VRSDTLLDIRRALWELLMDIKGGDIDAERAEAACSVLDSLAETVRLEAHAEGLEAKTGEDPEVSREGEAVR